MTNGGRAGFTAREDIRAQRETVAFAVLGVRPSADVAQPSGVEWREGAVKMEIKPGVEWGDVGCESGGMAWNAGGGGVLG
jgi:hypothetical protein